MRKFQPYMIESFEHLNKTASLEILLRHGKIRAEVVTEDHVFYDENGAPEAVITTISHLRTDDGNPQRPVMFIWNGGPGSATSMLQLECFGPYCVCKDGEEKPVYGLETEQDTILDVCDLVYVDPVGVGYSRLLREEAAPDYFSVDGDARSVAFAIADWLKKHSRWNSPIYLCGESYGTIRACRVLAELGRDVIHGNRMMLGLPVAGVILIGSSLSLDGASGRIFEPALELLTAALPSMAATHWYHNLQGQCDRESFLEEAWEFEKRKLIPALFEGDDCPAETVQSLAKELANYTGMEAAYFENTKLHLRSAEDFMIQVVSSKGKRVDLYDSRVTSPLAGTYNPVGDGNMPLSVMNGLLAETLGIDTDRIYYTGNLNMNLVWNYAVEDRRSHMDCLRSAAARMPEMKILAASGLYDLCTLAGNTRYQFSHSGIAPEQITLKEYPGGHGVYSSKEGKRTFLKDVRALICGR
ncbi:hypothetical protein ACDL92_05950 [Ihubacter sp. mB4P-1]|uniref:S10 family serine carboxypeptidase-like protein n=1 Tax=Ihubacter sp. mB4P-1 TaxID=3242370 RepID=UPI00137AA577